MSKVIPISPAQSKQTGKPAVDVAARLEKLEDSFLSALQEIRAVKAALKENLQPDPGLEKLLDAKQVAECLGENERWVYRQAKKNKIPSIRLGKYWKFSPAQLQKWLKEKNDT